MQPVYDCTACGACCREAFDAVEIDPKDAFVRLHPQWVITTPFNKTAVARSGDRCVCLRTDEGRFTCAAYRDRPQTCRDVAVDGPACRWARERVGLPIGPAPPDEAAE